MKLTLLSCIFLFLCFSTSFTTQIQGKKHSKKHDSSDGSKEEGNPAIDRLAVNLAGAFVKSIFPEIDRSVSQHQANDPTGTALPSSEIRRAPATPLSLQLLQQGGGLGNAALQQESQVPNPFGDVSSLLPTGLSQQKASLDSSLSVGSLLPSTSQLASLLTPSLSHNTDPAATVEAINAAKRQKYLIDLQRHQHELNQYSGKQLEYLDQQRRYQEAMVNHQAGAALLMQQQQQDFLNKMKNKYAGFETPTKQHSTTQEETLDHLKQYLNGRDLDEKMKEGILKALQYLDKENPRKTQAKAQEEHLELELGELAEAGRCHKCLVEVEVDKLKGSWTQVLSKTYSTLLSLLEFENNNQRQSEDDMNEPLTVNITTKRASCVGLEVGGKRRGQGSIGVNLYFRDDTPTHELYELNGQGRLVDNTLKMDLDLMQTSVCVAKAGPAEVSTYEYVVLADTSGPSEEQKCASYQVFARDTDEFHLRYYDDVADFLKTQVMSDRTILPVAALPSPKLCQLSSSK